MTTVYAVTRDTPDGPILCHFGPTTTFPTKTEALLALLFYTPGTDDYNVIALDPDRDRIPDHALPPFPRLES